jgi:hypothetical protein
MDCKTARLLLDFARPHLRELETEEAAALDRHLDHCCDCHTLARDERQFDEHIGKAMRQVDVPDGLRTQLLARLESERGEWQRQRFAQSARWTAAAAAVLLLGWGAWYWLMERLPAPLDPQRVVEAVTNDAAQDPRLLAENTLRRMGVDTQLSPHLNYNLLIAPPMESELPGYPGRKVPVLLFERSGRHATVYLVKERAVPADARGIAGGASYKAELLPRSQGEHYRYLVLHDGDNLDWLMPPEPPAS